MMRTTLDIRKLTRRQRWILWLLLTVLASHVASMTLPWPQYRGAVFVTLVVVELACYVLMVLGVVLVLTAQGNNVSMIMVCGMLMLAPCAGLLLLALVNMSVTRTLRRAGLRVGLMGVKDEDLERVLDPELCSDCGYNLTGNVSGRCPECGRAIQDG